MRQMLNDMLMMVKNKHDLFVGMIFAKNLHDRIVEFKMINKRFKDYKWLKGADLITPAVFNRWKEEYMKLLNLITIQVG